MTSSSDSPGWPTVDRRLARARETLAAARDEEHFQAVGLMCRELLLALAKTVYDPAVHKPIDGVPIGTADSRRMIESYLDMEVGNEVARKHARSALELANSLLHSQTADYRRAAMCFEATSSVVNIISITADRGRAHETIAALADRYIKTKHPGASHRMTLQRMGREPIGKKVASGLEIKDVLDLAQARRDAGIQPATISQDITYLRTLFRVARDEWNLNVSPEVVDQARKMLTKHKLVSASTRRSRLPSRDELERLSQYFSEYARRPKAKIPMQVLIEFALWSGRRIGDICRLRWADLDETNHTCVMRGVKGPGIRRPRDTVIYFYGKAWTIIQQQPRNSEYIFPYNGHSASALYTAAKKELGIKNLRLQDMTREATRRLHSAGYSLIEVARAIGRQDLNSLSKELDAFDAASSPR